MMKCAVLEVKDRHRQYTTKAKTKLKCTSVNDCTVNQGCEFDLLLKCLK